MFSKFIKRPSSILLFVIAIALAIYACQKKAEPQLQQISSSSIMAVKHKMTAKDLQIWNMQNEFYAQNLPLQENYCDSATVRWLPLWNDITTVYKGSSMYYYVRLNPVLFIHGHIRDDRKFMATGWEKILIAKVDSGSTKPKFMLAKYELATYKKGDKINFNDFTGTLVLNDFTNTTAITYNHSIAYPIIHANKAVTCDMECTWARWCNRGLSVVHTMGYDGTQCLPPMIGDAEIDCGINGTTSAYELSYSSLINCRPSVDNNFPPVPPNGNPNGQGGDGPLYGTATVYDFYDNLSSPCFKEVYHDLRSNFNSLLPNKVMDILNDFFPYNTKVNLVFEEDAFITRGGQPDYETDGATTIDTTAGGYVTIHVILNRTAIAHASKEYIMATMMHEIVHGYLYAIGQRAYFQHNEMGINFVNEMSKAIYSAYPTTMTVLQSIELAWGGLQDSKSWLTLPSKAKTDAINTNNYFKLGVMGTYCR